MHSLYKLFYIIGLLFLCGCATYKPQYKTKKLANEFPKDKKIIHSFYLLGDAGGSSLNENHPTLQRFKKELEQASENSTALFLGDNIYPDGMPKKNNEERSLAEHRLNVQFETLKDFKGKPVFIPGNHDWYNGIKGLKRQEKYTEKILGKNTFLPEDGCGIRRVKIGDDIVLITIDSHWFITDWDQHPTINDDCEIFDREGFFSQFKSILKKSQGKKVIVALHHPMFSVGPHGGQYHFKDYFTPFPGLGLLKNVLRKTSGVSHADFSHKNYAEMRKRLINLALQNEQVIFVSGHEHSLQYTQHDNVVQIVSGSGTQESPTKATGNTLFSYGVSGFARLDVFEDGSSFVRYYRGDTGEIVYQVEVFKAKFRKKESHLQTVFPKTYKASIYTQEEVSKTPLYKRIWGERYRDDYGVEVTAPTLVLDTIFGGLTPTRKGGGNQSKSLRLENPEGKEYVMRALRKNPLQFLQATAFKDQYLTKVYKNTLAENILKDGFTGSHPYAPFVIGPLADAANVYHSNPKLYYIPKQKILGEYNEDFGDELYMIEERVSSNHEEVISFGETSNIISTSDMTMKILKNQKHRIDEPAFVRARLFDMLIGDWDRHEDQWRWAVFEEENRTIYKPIPRDRDQAFSIMDDGWLMSAATAIQPTIRLLRSYDGTLEKPKWFNDEVFPLDKFLFNRCDKEVWDEQVKFLQKNITSEVIDTAFKDFPKEVDQQKIAGIREKLTSRIRNLQTISDKYFAHIFKYAVIKATDQSDYIDVKRTENGSTLVEIFTNKDKKNKFFSREYTPDVTSEIWIYGLDGEDIFQIGGTGSGCIPLRIVGGQNKDTFNLHDKKRIAIYDYESKENIFIGVKRKYHLTDSYKTNNYDYKKLKNNVNQVIPRVNVNPDDGLLLGVSDTYTKYGFERNPFSSRHQIKLGYYFATEGIDASYKLSVANVFKGWNVEGTVFYTSPNYSKNFFGFGNNSTNLNYEDDDRFGLNFNRVRLSQFKADLDVVRYGKLGSITAVGLAFENYDVEKAGNRFVNSLLESDPSATSNDFLHSSVRYEVHNADQKAFVSLGMGFETELGYQHNLKKDRGFPYLNSKLNFDYQLVPSGDFVLATAFGSQHNFNNHFEFYQAANLGANNGLRGYRNERFSGKHAFYQSSDLRYQFKQFRTGILPMNFGIFTGFDYGRVWVDGLNESKWNNSYGGGVFLNTAQLIAARLSVFKGRENVRVAFKLGFDF